MLFVHMFCHRQLGYLFEDRGPSDWITRHFFTGGMMPSEDWLTLFQRDLRLVERWWLNGVHYSKTCEAWLENLKRHEREARRLFGATYGVGEGQRWWVYWRLFFTPAPSSFAIGGERNGALRTTASRRTERAVLATAALFAFLSNVPARGVEIEEVVFEDRVRAPICRSSSPTPGSCAGRSSFVDMWRRSISAKGYL